MTPATGKSPGAPSADLSRRTRELSIISAIAQALNASADLETSLDAALRHVADLFDLRTGWIFLIDEASGVPVLAAARNLPSGLADHPARMTGRCYCLDTFEAGDLNGAANINVVVCSRLKWLSGHGTGGLRCHASVPLYADGRKLGVMNVASSEWRQLSPDDLGLLHTVGDMLAVAVDRSRLYAKSLAAGALAERNRLARELHDTLAQGIAATAMQLDAADALLAAAADPGLVRAAVAEALRLTRANLEEARRSVFDLRAEEGDGTDLRAGLERLVAAMRGPGGPAVVLSAGRLPKALPAGLVAEVGRIVREALMNAIRHANASAITVRCEADRERVRLAVEDDGDGFRPAAVAPGRFGLVGIEERARLLGGRLTLDTAPGRGTRVAVELPVR